MIRSKAKLGFPFFLVGATEGTEVTEKRAR
jgi:hypothetical protein